MDTQFAADWNEAYFLDKTLKYGRGFCSGAFIVQRFSQVGHLLPIKLAQVRMYPDGRCGRPVYFLFQALRFRLQDDEFIDHAFRSHTRLDGIDDAANVLFRPAQFRLETIMGGIVESCLASPP
jgi:hypothetical protein